MAWVLSFLGGAETGNIAELTSTSGTVTASATARTGGYSWSFGSDVNATINILGASSAKSFKIRLGIRLSGTPSGVAQMIYFPTNAGNVYLSVNSSRQLQTSGFGTTTNGSTVLTQNQWYYVDIFLSAESAASAGDGIYQVKLDGSTEISVTDGTGTDIGMSYIQLLRSWQLSSLYVDDCILAHENTRIGTAEFFGDGGINACRPSGDSSVEAPENTGDWAKLDDDPADDTSGSQVQLDAQTSELWTLTDTSGFDRTPSAINWARVGGRILTTGGTGQAQYLRSLKSGGSAQNSADLNATTSVAYYTFTPSTQPATASDVDSWEIGIAQDSTANEDPIATELYLMVDYAVSAGGSTYEDSATLGGSAGLSSSGGVLYESAASLGGSAGLSSVGESPTTLGLAPDVLISTTNLSGAVTDIDESPDSPDANWLTAPGSNNNTEAYVSFPTPAGTLVTGAGIQVLRAWVRKTSHSTNPTARIELWENGSLVSAGSDTAISSTSGQMLTYSWDATGRTAANIEAKVIGSVGGGSPSNRASVEVGAIEWQAKYTPSGSTYEDSASLGGSAGLSAAEALTLETTAALGGSAGLASDASGSTFEPAATLGGSAGLSSDAIATLEDAATLGGSAGLASAGGLLSENAATIAAAGGLTSVGGLLSENTASLAASAGLSAADALTLEGSATLAAAAGLEAQAAAILEDAIALAATSGVSAASVLIVSAAATLAASAGLASDGAIAAATYEEALTIAASAGLGSSSTLTLEQAATLAAAAGLSSSSEALFEASAALSAAAGLSADLQAVYEAAALLAASQALASASDLLGTIEASLSLGASAGLAADSAGSTFETAVALAAQAALAASGGFIFESTLALGATSGTATAGGLVLESALSLAQTSGLSADAANVLEAAAAIAASSGASAASALLLEAAASFAAQAGTDAAAGGSVYEAAASLALSHGMAAAAGALLEAGVSFDQAAAIVAAGTVGEILKTFAAASDAAATSSSASDTRATPAAASDSAATNASATDI